MIPKYPLFLALALTACGSKDDGSETDTDAVEGDADTDTDTDAYTGTETDTDTDVVDTDTDVVDTDTDPACDAISLGPWIADGQAFGMQMTGEVIAGPSACAFQLGNWDMVMDSPTGGTIVGDQVTLTGSAFWTSCTGTLVGGTEISGICAKDGSNFGMVKK